MRRISAKIHKYDRARFYSEPRIPVTDLNETLNCSPGSRHERIFPDILSVSRLRIPSAAMNACRSMRRFEILGHFFRIGSFDALELEFVKSSESR